jgi:hypothetical protein
MMTELDHTIREIMHEYRLNLHMTADRRKFVNEMFARGFDIVRRPGLTKVTDSD